LKRFLRATTGTLLLLAGSAVIGSSARAGDPQVRVQEGDTLGSIAQRHGTSVEAIARLNGISDPNLLLVGQLLNLPAAAVLPASAPRQPPETQAALLLSPAERRDRTEMALRELGGIAGWRRFGQTAVDWNGWRLHPGGVRITLVRPAAAELGVRRAGATAVAVQCSSLRQAWRVDGAWEPWNSPAPGSTGLQIMLDLCSNTVDGPAVPVPPSPEG